MTTQVEIDQWQKIREIQKDHGLFYKALLIGLGVLIGGALFGDAGYITNLWTEGLSVGLTVLVLNTLAEHREEKRRIKDLQDRLVMEAVSQSNEAAKRAIDELRARGWLTGEDSLLHLIRLSRANLKEADLWGANLKRVTLWRTNLKGANLTSANLQEALLWHTYLQGAMMRYINLQGADLTNAQFDETTILPDGKAWTPETDLTRFTDPNHPNFWRSDNPASPAYRGD